MSDLKERDLITEYEDLKRKHRENMIKKDALPADKWTQADQDELNEIESKKNRVREHLQNLPDHPDTVARLQNVVNEIGAYIEGLQPDQYGNNVTLDQGLTPPHGLQILIRQHIFDAISSDIFGFSRHNHLHRSSTSQFDVRPIIECLSRYRKQLTGNPPANYIELESRILDLDSELESLFTAHSNI